MFTDRLSTTLSLTIGTQTVSFSAGSIDQFDVELEPWGFEAAVTFHVDASQVDDPVFDSFSSTELACATFTLQRQVEGEDDDTAALKVVGYGVERSVSETTGAGLKGAPVVRRSYHLRFVDAAQAFWNEHRPIDLYADASMQDVLELHKPVGVDITYDFALLSQKQSVFCVGMSGEGRASFYDFVMWWIDRNQAVFEFDGRSGLYRVGGKKSTRSSANPLDREDIAEMRVLFPEPARFAGRVLNPFANASTTKDLVNATAATGVRRDVLVHTPIAAIVDSRAQIEGQRTRARPHGLRITYRRCPDIVSQCGDLLLVEDGFSENLFASGNQYRVVGVKTSGMQSPGQSTEPEDPVVVYNLQWVVTAESKGSLVPTLPPYQDPRQRVRFEGKIVSSGGTAADRSWAATENEDTSLSTYKVFVPLYNKTIPAPFGPTFASGHFFFPAYKDQRVLLDVEWDQARIIGFLDWADEARLPSDSQGNQIVLGYQAANGTVIRHAYEEAQPVLTIERKTGTETATMEMSDGIFRISLEESLAIPSVILTYDVSPQVDAAKDQITGEVGNSVGQVTAQFQTAVGQVSDRIDATAQVVEDEIRDAERGLNAQLNDAETALQNLAADAGEGLATVTFAVSTGKAQLVNALSSVDDVKAPLQALLGRIESFSASANLQQSNWKTRVDTFDGAFVGAIDQAVATAAQLRSRAESSLSRLRQSVEELGSNANKPPFTTLRALRAEVLAARNTVGQVTAGLEGDLQSSLRLFLSDWQPFEADVTRLRTSFGASTGRASQEWNARYQGLIAELSAKAGGRTGSVESGAELRAQLDAAYQASQSGLSSLRSQTESVWGGLVLQMQGYSATGESGLRASAETSTKAITQAGATLDGALGTVDALLESLEQAANDAVASLLTATDALNQAVMVPLDAIPEAAESARYALNQATSAAKETLQSLLDAIASMLATLETLAKAPIEAVLAAIDTAEQTMNATLKTASTTLDSMLQTATTTVGTLISTFQSIVDGACTGIDTVRALVSGLEAQIKPPIDALEDIVGDIQSIFQTGVNLLTGFIDTGVAALGAIPAAALPKEIVDPTISTINAALSAVLPLVETAATTVGGQLTTLSNTLLSQVDTAENAAVSAISSFVATLDAQVAAIVPPIEEQLGVIQTQIDTAVSGVVAQINTATASAVAAVQATLQTIVAQAQLVGDAATTQIDNAEGQLTQTLATVQTGFDQAKTSLETQANTAAAQLAAEVADLETSLDETVARVEQGITSAQASLMAQFESARIPVDAALGSVRTQLAGARASLQKVLASAIRQNQTIVAQVRAALPTEAALDAQIASLSATMGTRFDSLATQLQKL